MWRTTAPYLRSAIRVHWRQVGVLAVGGFVSGLVATSKSVLESAIIQQVADAIGGGRVDNVWNTKLDRLSSGDGDWVTRLTGDVLPNVTLVSASALYALVTVTGALIFVVTVNAREKTSRTLFGLIYADGLREGFTDTAPPAAESPPPDPPEDAEREEPGEPGGLAGAIQQGATSVAASYGFLLEATQFIVALLTVVSLLAKVSLELTAFCVAFAAAFSVVSWTRGRALAVRRESYDLQRRQLFALTDDVLTNRDVLLAHERRDLYVSKLTTSARQLATIDKALSVREQGFSSLVNVLYDLGRIGILAVVLWQATRGTAVERVGDAYFYTAIFSRLMTPVQGLLRGYDDVRRSMSSSRTLVELLQRPATVTDGKGSKAEPYDGRDAIVFDDVSFAYPSKQVLRNCSFRVPRGGVTLLLGRSGSGKTTISRMALGFLTPSSGDVTVLGRKLGDWEHIALLEEMSYLAQTGHVVQGSVRENLFAHEDASEDVLQEALVAAGLVISRGAAQDFLGREATNLSEGQRQRLALARILVDRSPLVVLDEPIAGIDAFTFAEVRQAVESWLESADRTVLLVSHRLAFTSTATYVVVVGDDGTVLEEGTPADLAARDGSTFARLLATEKAELAVPRSSGTAR